MFGAIGYGVRMVGSFLVLVAALSQPMEAAAPARAFHPAATASAHATARIQVISGVKFGQDYPVEPAGAARRQARLTEADGRTSPAELLEFQ